MSHPNRSYLAGSLLAMAICASPAFAQGYPVFKVADTSTQIPGAPPGQTFTSFDAPVASREPDDIPGANTAFVAFRAQGPNGLIGIYNALPAGDTPSFTPFRIADTTTPIPLASPGTTFADFTRPTLTKRLYASPVYFTGGAPSGDQGVYGAGLRGEGLSSVGAGGRTRATAPSAMENLVAFAQGDPDGLMTLMVRDITQITSADDGYLGPPSLWHFGLNGPPFQTTVAYTARDNPIGPMNQIRAYWRDIPGFKVETAVTFSTPIPGGSGTFTALGDPAASSNSLYFKGSGTAGQQGIYEYHFPPGPTGAVTLVDRNTPVPGRPGVTFTSFSDPAALGFLFQAVLSDGNEALYANIFIAGGPNGLSELISTGDIIDGKTIDALEISREATGGTHITNYAFKATFTDGSQGIYVLKLPEPGTMSLTIAALTLLVTRRRTTTIRGIPMRFLGR